MSRPRGVLRDPTRVTALSPDVGRDIRLALRNLTPTEAEVLVLRFGLLDGEPRNYRQVADAMSMWVERVRAAETTALAKLRDPEVVAGVRDHLLDEVSAGVLDHAREESLARQRAEALRWCPRHQWVWRDAATDRCAACECGVRGYGDRGRPSTYCRAACRQAAYRARRRDGTA